MSTGEKWGTGVMLLAFGTFLWFRVRMVIWAPDDLERERESLAKYPWMWFERDSGPLWYRVAACGFTGFLLLVWVGIAYQWVVAVFGLQPE